MSQRSFRKATGSGANANCVEVAVPKLQQRAVDSASMHWAEVPGHFAPEAVLISDSKVLIENRAPLSPDQLLAFTPEVFTAFMGAVRELPEFPRLP